MKKLLIVLAVVGVFSTVTTVHAFDLAVGARYAGLGALGGITTGGGLLQGEILLGPLQVAAGYTDLGGGITMYPLTVGFITKFPIPIVKPYIGADFTYYLMPGLTAGLNQAFQDLGYTGTVEMNMFGFCGKAGAEVRIGPAGVYFGVGYGYTMILLTLDGQMAPPMGAPGLTWEVGGRFYFL